MQITFDNTELLEFIHNILCDGLYHMVNYGFDLDFNEEEYKASKAKLHNPNIEDVQLQMIKDGYGLTFTDVEGEGENTKTLTLDLVRANIDSVPVDVLKKFIGTEADYDAGDADTFLQYLLFREVVFG